MKNFKKLLNKEFDCLIPAQSERLKNTPIISAEQEEKPKKKFSLWKAVVSFSCVLVFAVISVFAVNFVSKPTDKVKAENYSSYITLSVNPSFSLLTNKDGTVEKVVAENYDGEIVLSGLTFKKEKYDEAIEIIMTECKKLGFITSSDGVTVEVSCKDDKIYGEIKNKITTVVGSIINGEKTFTIEKKDESFIEKIASKYVDYITSESDFDEIIEALKNVKGFFEEQQNGQSDSDGVTDLMILKVVLECAEEQAECFEEIDEIMQEYGFSSVLELVLSCSNPLVDYSEDIGEALYELSELCFEADGVTYVTLHYAALKEKYSFGLTEDVIEEKSDKVDECLDSFDENSYNGIMAFLKTNSKLDAVFQEIKIALRESDAWSKIFEMERFNKVFRLQRQYKGLFN